MPDFVVNCYITLTNLVLVSDRQLYVHYHTPGFIYTDVALMLMKSEGLWL